MWLQGDVYKLYILYILVVLFPVITTVLFLCHCRRSFDSSYLHRVSAEELAAGSNAPGGGGGGGGESDKSMAHLHPASRSQSVKPRQVVVSSRDSLNSDSSDSDVTLNRRSGSVERQDVSTYTIQDVSTYTI